MSAHEIRARLKRLRKRLVGSTARHGILPFGALEGLVQQTRTEAAQLLADRRGAIFSAATLISAQHDQRPTHANFVKEDGTPVCVYGRNAVEFLQQQCSR